VDDALGLLDPASTITARSRSSKLIPFAPERMLGANMKLGLLLGAALAFTTVTIAPAQELTPYQNQVLGGVKKLLVEYTQKQHSSCDDAKICDLERVDVLDEVLNGWENTPDYGKYAVNVMDWQGKRAVAIATVAHDYVAKHGRPDAGLDYEVQRKITANRAFDPPKEYLCRHMFGTPHLSGSQGPCK
jgi:hypothetical protein